MDTKGTFVDITAFYSSTCVTIVAIAFKATQIISTFCVYITVVTICDALIYVSTIEAIAHEASVTFAIKSIIGIGTCCLYVTRVCSKRTFISIISRCSRSSGCILILVIITLKNVKHTKGPFSYQIRCHICGEN